MLGCVFWRTSILINHTDYEKPIRAREKWYFLVWYVLIPNMFFFFSLEKTGNYPCPKHAPEAFREL